MKSFKKNIFRHNLKAFIYLVPLLFIVSGCEKNNMETYSETFNSMGTIVEIQVRGIEESLAQKAIDSAKAEIIRLDEKYSTYKENNFMYRLNHIPLRDFRVDSETFFILKECERINKITEGKFDPSIGEIIDLVGFEKDSVVAPSTAEMEGKLKRSGWENVKLIPPDSVKLSRRVIFNFGGIVKGYAVDRMIKKLKENGVNDALVNAGGEIRCMGGRWIVGIRNPKEDESVLFALKLENKAIATSGSYEQSVELNGKKITHIFDPVTGSSANRNLSISVIAGTTITADALATGLFLLDPRKVLEIVESIEGVECFVVDSDGVNYKSSGFDNLLSD